MLRTAPSEQQAIQCRDAVHTLGFERVASGNTRASVYFDVNSRIHNKWLKKRIQKHNDTTRYAPTISAWTGNAKCSLRSSSTAQLSPMWSPCAFFFELQATSSFFKRWKSDFRADPPLFEVDFWNSAARGELKWSHVYILRMVLRVPSSKRLVFLTLAHMYRKARLVTNLERCLTSM